GQAVVAWVRGYPYNNNYYFYLDLTAGPLDAAWPDTPTENFGVYQYYPNYDSISQLAVTVDPKGLALVLFYYSSSSTAMGSPVGVYYARKPVQDDWQSPVKIPGTGTIGSGPILASDDAGAMA